MYTKEDEEEKYITTIMPFGKHKGEEMGDIPTHYLEWLNDNCKLSPWLKKVVEYNLMLRKQEDVELPFE